jgi:hypothetical protein
MKVRVRALTIRHPLSAIRFFLSMAKAAGDRRGLLEHKKG